MKKLTVIAGPVPIFRTTVAGRPTVATHKKQHHLSPTNKPTLEVEAGSEFGKKDQDLEINQAPPSIFWRCVSAFLYVIPWIDAMYQGTATVYSMFKSFLPLYHICPLTLLDIYQGNHFTPLIIFFAIFLGIVKNRRIHHFVRYNAMQSVQLDLLVMGFQILNYYCFTAQMETSWLYIAWDVWKWFLTIPAILYCVFWTLR